MRARAASEIEEKIPRNAGNADIEFNMAVSQRVRSRTHPYILHESCCCFLSLLRVCVPVDPACVRAPLRKSRERTHTHVCEYIYVFVCASFTKGSREREGWTIGYLGNRRGDHFILLTVFHRVGTPGEISLSRDVAAAAVQHIPSVCARAHVRFPRFWRIPRRPSDTQSLSLSLSLTPRRAREWRVP